MNICYKKPQFSFKRTGQHLMFGNANIGNRSTDDTDDRSTVLFNSYITELQTNLDCVDMDFETISNLLVVLCNSIKGLFDITAFIDQHVFIYFIDCLDQSPIYISKIFKDIFSFSDAYDDFFLNQKQLLVEIISKEVNDELINNMISVVSSLALRHPELMIEFIRVLFTKKINIDIARFVYHIIPIAQYSIQNKDDYIKISNLISQIIICNDLNVILVGLHILDLAIECNDKFLMQSFGASQLQYESLLYHNEIKKIAAGYNALTITMICIKNRNECIKSASNVLQMAEKHIKLVPNVLKQSIIQYVCEYSIMTKNCIEESLFMEILQLADDGNFFIRDEAANCIAISIIETKRKFINIKFLAEVFSNHIGGNNEVVLNIINALRIILDYTEKENGLLAFTLEVLNNFNLEELLQSDDDEINEAAQSLLAKIIEAGNQED